MITDVLVLGSEGAGARAAISAVRAGAQVTVMTKGHLGRSGATLTAEGGMNIDGRSAAERFGLRGGQDDSPEAFFADTVSAGRYLNDQRLVAALVEEGPDRVQELVEWGMKIAGLIRVAGNRYSRTVYSSGQAIVRALHRGLGQHPVQVLEHTMAVDLLVRDGQCVGALALDLATGDLQPVLARATVLATGGAMMVYPVQTAPEELTGDGQAMAWRAGAELMDMEFSQFMPACLLEPQRLRGNQFPMQIGPLSPERLHAHLLNRYGERFMARWDPERVEHTTRDMLAIGIMTEILEGRGSSNGGVWLSLKHLPNNLIDDFARWALKPNLREDWFFHGVDFKEIMARVKAGDALEVAVASHFFMGGVRVNEHGATSLPGLYAAGEVSTGLHGANRVGGNALTQVLVQGARAGTAAAGFARAAPPPAADPAQLAALLERVAAPLARDRGENAFQLNNRLQQVAWEKAGVIRRGPDLEAALAEVREIGAAAAVVAVKAKDRPYNREWVAALELPNKVIVAEAIVRSALARTESRGAHYRTDFRERNDAAWLRNVTVRNQGGRMVLDTVPAVLTRLRPD